MRHAIAVLAVAALALAGCSSDSGTATDGTARAQAGEQAPFELDAAPVATTHVTAVKSYKFEPQVIEVGEGSEVTWINEDDFPHNVHLLTGDDETYDLPIGESVSVTFDTAGDHYYECSIHPQQMRGLVTVTG